MKPDLIKLKNDLPSTIYSALENGIIENYAIDTNLKLAYFLAQTNYESGGFKRTVENLNYSAPRLLEIFPKYFDETSAKEYAGKPEKIANRVYASRFGNGNEASGDGWKFRGRGYIQLTFKSNYKSYADFIAIDLVANPDIVASDLPLDSAAHFFQRNKIFDLCKDDAEKTSEAITKKVSGSNRTAADRYKLFNNYYSRLSSLAAVGKEIFALASDSFNQEYPAVDIQKIAFELFLENRKLTAASSQFYRVNKGIVNFHEGESIGTICTCGVNYSDDENGGGGNCAHYVCTKDLWNITNQDGIRFNCPAGYGIQAEDLKSYCDKNPVFWIKRNSSSEFSGQGLVFGIKGGRAKHVGIYDTKDAIYHYGFTKKKILKNKLTWWEKEYDSLVLFERKK